MKDTVNVLYPNVFREVWFNVVLRAYERHNWNPIYMIADNKYENVIRDKIPKAIFHDRDKAIVGMPSDECINEIEIPVIDKDIINRFKEDESLVLHMLDRYDSGNSFTYRERVYYYYKMLRYWMGVLNHYKPDMVVYPHVPHMGYDYVIYMLCKEKNIATSMFLELPFGKITFTGDYKNHFPIWHEYEKLKNNEVEVNLPGYLEKHLSDINDSYDKAIPFFMKRNKNKYLNNMLVQTAKMIKGKINNTIKNTAHLLTNLPRRWDVKEKGKKWNYIITKKMHRKYRKYDQINRLNYTQYYKKHTTDFDIKRKYVYVPMHYQPEESSCPRGEIYAHQNLLIHIVSCCIPDDWKVYVREHPLQFYGSITGSRSRSIQDYEQILEIPNVELIDTSVSSFELIDNAKAVATITGTAGWEAVIRGIPVLLFGHPWYKGCEGVFYTPTVECCRDAINIIEKGYKPDIDKVRLFAYVADTHSIRGVTNPKSEQGFGIERNNNVKNVTDYLLSIQPDIYKI